ncbi:MAG: hypothetical protein IJX34_04955 [Clostridia bacterium]|nr:hypothetical protein [Clostridia bacterium]
MKVLAYFIEIYLRTDDVAVIYNYKGLKNIFKNNLFFEYTMLTDFSDGNLKALGGFRKSILDKWCEYISYATADIISSHLTQQPVMFKNRCSFVKTLIKLKKSNIYEMANARKKNDLGYFFSIIPEEYLKKIALFSMALENSTKDSQAILRKYQLEAEIYRYISCLYYDKKMQVFSKDEQEELVCRLLKLSRTPYNPDIKLNCGLI